MPCFAENATSISQFGFFPSTYLLTKYWWSWKALPKEVPTKHILNLRMKKKCHVDSFFSFYDIPHSRKIELGNIKTVSISWQDHFAIEVKKKHFNTLSGDKFLSHLKWTVETVRFEKRLENREKLVAWIVRFKMKNCVSKTLVKIEN